MSELQERLYHERCAREIKEHFYRYVKIDILDIFAVARDYGKTV
jgi:hypothetical protein